MKKNLSPTEKKSKVLMAISFIFLCFLFASCTKEDVTPNSGAAGTTQARLIGGVSDPTVASPPPSVLPSNAPTLGSSTFNQNLPHPVVPVDAAIFISHSSCFGQCPAYTITVKANGNVVFYGINFTSTLGAYEFTISKNIVNQLQDMMVKEGFLKFNNAYPYAVDMPQNITALRVVSSDPENCGLKTVVDYGVQIPQELIGIRNMIEAALGIDRLVYGVTDGALKNQ